VYQDWIKKMINKYERGVGSWIRGCAIDRLGTEDGIIYEEWISCSFPSK
jgi:hypothetical protein